MHFRLQEISDQLDRAREQLRASVESVPAGERMARPSPDRWSVAEVIEHLAIAERRIAGMIATKVAAAREAGLARETEASSAVDSKDLSFLLDRGRALQAPEVIHPKSNLDADAAWDALTKSRGLLLGVMSDADGWALGAVTHPHAVAGQLNLYQWFSFVATHELRHAQQIDEIGQQLRGV